jgi:hypothetical protein
VRRDEHLESMLLPSLKDMLDALDGRVIRDALPDRCPCGAFSLKTSFCGSMKTTAVSSRLICIVAPTRFVPWRPMWRDFAAADGVADMDQGFTLHGT